MSAQRVPAQLAESRRPRSAREAGDGRSADERRRRVAARDAERSAATGQRAASAQRAAAAQRERDVRSGRPTVRITGRPDAPPRRSPTAAQISARPDRVAMWAVMLGLLLAGMAAATARGAEAPAPGEPPAQVQALR